MIRRRSTPWIHRFSRLLIAGIASCGALVTGYLTIVKLRGGEVACTASSATAGSASGCNSVLSSPWATVLGQPLALFGFLAYFSMLVFALAPLLLKSGENKEQRQKLENLTWTFLLIGSIAMTVFSSYLMYVLFSQIKTVCPYCIASALFSLTMLVLTIIGRSWEDIGQIFFTAVIVGMVTLIGTLGVYAGVTPNGTQTTDSTKGGPISFVPQANPQPGVGWEVTTTSGEAEIALARHLKEIGAKEYIAWWCPHCHEQKLLFGKEAYQEVPHTDCAPADNPNNVKPECKTAGIESYPTWKIKGKTYTGAQSLEELAKVSGYQGPTNFKYYLRR
ncbi:vitamin K epoxide reductase family protein [Rivularia sp. UHCC 0363]|uniref:vitamin K epoxide reductase family protein n=1 Tax=Rivularia sp. UHCC 0363 TaxID=3110244 RepID=UPI002B203A0E|nr:vitamin K epoxide reductase family protein [Rivularia sp. UHCC 0363]MEA5597720.1 vitamin K epoxide reductase family protein [Rivularia sp. UHCC 0363]